MKRICVLSGAGISAESGISTFRDSNGLWENYEIEDVATPQAWRKDPDLVSKFYNLRRKQILEVEPNSAHCFLADLEKQYEVQIITQNIDDLHERAGSKNVLHLHGLITLAKSSGPNAESKYYPIRNWELKATDVCDEGFRLRPHVVWFGEAVPELDRAARIISTADVLLVIGTSLNVYPAAGLIHAAPAGCMKLVVDPKAEELNVPDFRRISKSAVAAVPELASILLA